MKKRRFFQETIRDGVKVSWPVFPLTLVMVGLLASPSVAGTLEPPPSAVDESGNPVPTTQTQPSWDQTLPAAERFVLVMGGAAVLDKNTGLVWEQSPLTTTHTWSTARFQCIRREVGGQMGWRLPSIPELASLVVPGNPAGGPDLPPGHPFSNVQSFYWSATTNVDNPTSAWVVGFSNGVVGPSVKTLNGVVVWCVRGGMNADAY